MITQFLIDDITKFSTNQSELYGVPSLFQLNLSKEKGQLLAQELKANKEI